LKILRAIHSLNPAIGGPLESIKQSSIALAARGHAVEIVCLDAADAAWLRDFPVRVHALGPGGSYGYTPRLVPWITDREREFDAMIVHGLWLYNGFGVWRALRRSNTPYFVFPHGMLDPWFKRAYPLKHVKKVLYWMAIEHRVLRDAAAVLFTSEEERRLAEKSFWPYRCNGIVVSYGTAVPDVDLAQAREDFLNQFPDFRGKQILLFLGRIHEKKGCDLLIDAFANAWGARAPAPALSGALAGKLAGETDSGLHLVLAGPCADERYLLSLKQRASQSGAPVTFTGMLSGNLKWGAFAAADAFVLPSHQENFGIAVAEALACGTPVLISNKVNIWREIEQERAGFVEDDDLAGTTRLLERWLATAAQDRQSMRANAKKCFAAHFDINRATDSLLSILQEFVGAK
jgi:glycosyltransferase involved in cell wall biosynthesis